MVAFTQQARRVWVLAQQEAGRLQHHYVGPEHLLLGLLRHGDSRAAGVLRAHGLDLETAQAEVGRLVARGVLPAPRPSDDALLATLGIDPVAVRRRLRKAFGAEAVDQATQRVRTRPGGAVPWPPMGGTPLLAKRVFAWPTTRLSHAARRSAPSTCCWGCSATPATRPEPSFRLTSRWAPTWACPTTTTTRSGCWWRPGS